MHEDFLSYIMTGLSRGLTFLPGVPGGVLKGGFAPLSSSGLLLPLRILHMHLRISAVCS